jgi:hypothetical protein
VTLVQAGAGSDELPGIPRYGLFPTRGAEIAAMATAPAFHPTWRPLGEILVERGLITRGQLEQALAEQKQEGGRLGEILFAHEWVSAIDLKDALAEQHGLDLRVESSRRGMPVRPIEAQPGSFPLGWLLVRQGQITEADLDQALAQQHQTGERLGRILIANGSLSTRLLAAALAEQQGLVTASQELWEAAQNSRDGIQACYQVRELEGPNSHLLHTSGSYLDATDLAFAILQECEPDQLHVVRVKADQPDELCWKYPPD